MTKLVDKTLLKAKVGSYLTGTAPALGDANLLGIARMRRREISQRMVALDAETSKRKILPRKYLISRNIDGEFTCLIFSHGEAVSLNPYGTVRTRAPFHGEARARRASSRSARRSAGSRSSRATPSISPSSATATASRTAPTGCTRCCSRSCATMAATT